MDEAKTDTETVPAETVSTESVPTKTPKQLKKEAEKAAKLEKFKAKQEKQSAIELKANDKPKKKEVPAKAKTSEVESKLLLKPNLTEFLSNEFFFFYL